MKKLFAIMFVALFISTSALANGVQTQQIAVANPEFHVSEGPGIGFGGQSGVTSWGSVRTQAYAQGTRSANAVASATGTGTGDTFWGRYESPTFGVAASGAAGTIHVVGAGAAVGVDRWFGPQPDYAEVTVEYHGFTGQGNGFGIDNYAGTKVGGFNNSSTEFVGGSNNNSDGTICGWERGVPAVTANIDGASGFASGYTLGGYVAGPNFSKAAGVTSSESGHTGDYGRVQGSGQINHQTFAGNQWGANGSTWGHSSYGYDGETYGKGIAKTGGMTVIGNGANYNTVTSISAGSSNVFSIGNQSLFPDVK